MAGGDNEKHKKGQHELGLTIQKVGGRRTTDSRQAQKGGSSEGVEEEGGRGREKYSSGADNHLRRGKEPQGGGFVRNAQMSG